MKGIIRGVAGLFAVLILASAAWGAVPQLINFQGVLTTPGGTPVADGPYSVTFTIYDSATGGAPLWSEPQSVTTSGGVFSTLLGSINPIPDSAFNDSSRYLGITVAPDAEMAPRQKLASVAFANRVASLMGASGGLTVEIGDPGDTLFSLIDEGTPTVDMACPQPPAPVGPCFPWVTATVGNPSAPMGQRAGLLRVLGCNGVINFRVNGWSGDVQARGKATFGPGHVNAAWYSFVAGAYNTVTPAADQATIPGGYCNVASDDYATVGGGTANTASAIYSTVAGGQSNVSNAMGATVGGGMSNAANDTGATVGGGGGNQSLATYSTIGGGLSNLVNPKGVYDFIGGGTNNVTSLSGNGRQVIGGGDGNFIADGHNNTIAGGVRNAIVNPVDGSFIGGGAQNTITSGYAAVAGGQNDTANGWWSAIGGGMNNVVNGNYSVIPGGLSNTAFGAQSLAAGTFASAGHDCAFVWADCCVDAQGLNQPFFSQGPNTFNARATGGFYFATSCDLPGTPISSGVFVPAGGGAWAPLSDSAAKHNIRPVNGSEILAKLGELPIKRWSYKTQADGIDHIGPMAQDFYRLFGLGDDEKHISTLDPDGIALAAAKELYARSLAQQAEIESLKSQISKQASEFGELKSQLAGLQATLETVLAAQATQGDLKLSAVTGAADVSGR